MNHAQVQQNIDKVEAAFTTARDAWSDSGNVVQGWYRSLTGDGDERLQVLGAIQMQYDNAAKKWEQRGAELENMGAAATQADWDKWTKWGQEIIADVNYQAKLSLDSSMWTIIADTASETARQVGDGVGKALTFWGQYGTYITVGAVLLVLAFLAWRASSSVKALLPVAA